MTDADLAAHLAETAGRLLLEVRASGLFSAKALGKARILPVHVMVDRRRKLHGDAVAAHADWPVVPMASVVEQMGDRRAPVGQFAGRSAAAQAFAALWQTIEKRLAK